MKTAYKFVTTLIIFFTFLWSFRDQIPSVKKDLNIDDQNVFSIDKAVEHVKNISIQPHFTGSSAHKNVQKYIVSELEKLGLKTEVQTQTIFNKKWKTGTTVENIVATIKGTTNQKALLLLTHYDSSPHSSKGASDAGSGVATILEGLRVFLHKKTISKNDIVILFSDAEELGLLGAEAFVKHHPLAKKIGLVLNFEARGSGGPSYMLLETNGKNSSLLHEFIKANPNYPSANSLMYSIYKMLPNDTDLTVFREQKNINGFNFSFIGDHFDYHTAQDTYERLDKASLLHQADYFTSNLNHFSNVDLTNLNSTKDNVFVNFPFIKLLTFPFSWIGYLLTIATIAFLVLIFIGLRKHKLTIHGIFKSFIPFLTALIVCGGVSFLLWKLILRIHPSYNDILHGFTYNGYEYILAFIFLNLWLLILIYNKFKNQKTTDLFIAPIVIWLLINFLIYLYLKGAAFLIIPVFIALIILSFSILSSIKRRKKPIIFVFLSIPTIYMFTPLIKTFPVGLGLKSLFISALFIVLIFGLLIPVFHQQKNKFLWQWLFGIVTIILFIKATYNSGFSTDKKKPNSLVYIQNNDDNIAFWATYNNTFDAYTKQIFNTDYQKGNITSAIAKSKYNSRFKYYKKTAFKNVNSSSIIKKLDTLINNKRHLEILITPTRKIHKYTFTNNSIITIESLLVNGIPLYTNEKLDAQIFFTYHMSNSDKHIILKLICEENKNIDFAINEISYDLLKNNHFNLSPRDDTMMPMPFVTNDAIICTSSIQF